MMNDTRIPAILKLLEKFNQLDFSAREITSGKNDEIDDLIKSLNTLGENLSEKRTVFVEQNKKIEDLLEVMLKFTALDFSQKATVSHEGDQLDAMAAGLNTLAEELEDAIALERKNTKSLTESEKKYRQLIETAPDAIIIINSDGRIIGWNREAEIVFGWKEEEVLGRLLANTIIPEKYREQHTKGLKHFMETGEGPVLNKIIELSGITKDHAEFPVELKISASKINEDFFFIGFIRDISKRKKAEEAKKQSEERFRLLVENVKDYAIINLDKEGNITSWNKGAELIIGYKAEEIVGKNISAFYTGEDREKNTPSLNLIKTEESGRYESFGWRVKKDRTQFWADVVYTASYDEKGTLRGFTKITRDITKQRDAQEKIMQLNMSLEKAKSELEVKVRERTASLEKSNKDLRDYARIISHDLKAPLRAIGTLSDLVLSDYYSNLDEEGRQKLMLIKNRVLRLDKMVSGILEYSEAGQEPAILRLIDLNQLVADIIREINPPKHISILLKNKLPQLEFYRKSLHQVFFHLISNAVKYNDKAKGFIEIGCEEEQQHWKFYVSDNGPGIPKEFHDKIFTIFQTLTPRDQVEGTGIGLALIKKIIELKKGKVWVESTVGNGATFFFTLPKK